MGPAGGWVASDPGTSTAMVLLIQQRLIDFEIRNNCLGSPPNPYLAGRARFQRLMGEGVVPCQAMIGEDPQFRASYDIEPYNLFTKRGRAPPLLPQNGGGNAHLDQT